MSHTYYIYLMTNNSNNVLYTGITNDLARRITEHKLKEINGFTAKYNVVKLVYYEEFSQVEEAITREKQIKAGSRKKKIALIESINPEWTDLSEELE